VTREERSVGLLEQLKWLFRCSRARWTTGTASWHCADIQRISLSIPCCRSAYASIGVPLSETGCLQQWPL